MFNKFTSLFSILMFALLISGCSSKSALDIKISELETVCEFVDALDQTVSEMEELVGNEGVSEADREEFDQLAEKAMEIERSARDKFDRTEAESCDSWDDFQEKSKTVGPHIRP